MAQGLSLHIGINQVDANRYDGWFGKLRGCENDASDMKAIADKHGFQSTFLLTSDATYLNVIKQIGLASSKLQEGDIFLLTYAGHGSQVKDVSGDETEDNLDETWVLYDRMLLDDELYQLWSTFRKDVRIVVISDSCHSGSIARDGESDFSISKTLVSRNMPDDIAISTYAKYEEMYDASQWLTFRGHDFLIEASIISISACQDNQSAYDGEKNGKFTAALKAVWKEGSFNGSYYKFHEAIVPWLPPIQSPKYSEFGSDNTEFKKQPIFTI